MPLSSGFGKYLMSPQDPVKVSAPVIPGGSVNVPITLEARAGNGAVPTGSYTLLVPANPKRRWFLVKVPTTEADAMLLVLSRSEPSASVPFANILLESGDAVVISMNGDMPWQGAIWATGLSADSSCYWSEIEDYP